MKRSISFTKSFRFFLPLACVTTLFFGTLYASVQQNYRQSANDPQIQIAQDIAHDLNIGKKISLGSTVDITNSLSSFVILFDQKGNVVSSQGLLHGTTPTLPSGIFSYMNSRQQDQFTWQPASDTRIAAVVEKYNGGFVLAGRNIKEVETRESQLAYITLGGWIMSLIGSAILTIAL